MHVWCFDGTNAIRVGVPNALTSKTAHVLVTGGQSLDEAMAEKFRAFFENGSPCVLKTMALLPGEYYRRMARPSDQHPEDSPGSCPELQLFENEIAVSRGQLISLIDRLQQICQTVHPSTETSHCYGHEIRNLLILACTEVEAQWKGILQSNGYLKTKYTTNDYVRLNAAMHLGEYRLQLSHYPWLEPLSPFLGWGTTGKPTQELDWYDAYNKVKHDREANFREANLIHTVNAVSACALLLFAQYGLAQAANWRHEIVHFFAVQKSPKFCPSEIYTYPYPENSQGYASVNYPFSA